MIELVKTRKLLPYRGAMNLLATLLIAFASVSPPTSVAMPPVGGEQQEEGKKDQTDRDKAGDDKGAATSSTARTRPGIKRTGKPRGVMTNARRSEIFREFRPEQTKIANLKVDQLNEILKTRQERRQEFEAQLAALHLEYEKRVKSKKQPTREDASEQYAKAEKAVRPLLRARSDLAEHLLERRETIEAYARHHDLLEHEALFYEAVVTELNQLQGNQIKAQLQRFARTAFSDIPDRGDIELTPLGSGGNADVFRGRPANEQQDFAYKFESRFEFANDSEAAGIPVENIGGAGRAQASRGVAEIFQAGELLLAAQPVLVDGRPAQEMELLPRDFVEPFEKQYTAFPDDQQEAELADYRKRQQRITEANIADVKPQGLTNHAEGLLNDRVAIAQKKIEGNPEQISRLSADRLNPRLGGTGAGRGLNDPVLQQQLNRLQYLDLITGQVDRNNSNILIRFKPGAEDADDNDVDTPALMAQVKGIDNNLSFGTTGEVRRADNRYKPLGTLPRLPKKIDLEMAARIKQVSVKMFEKMLNKRDETKALSKEQKKAAIQRYELVRDHVKGLIEDGDVVMSPERAQDGPLVTLLRKRAGVPEDKSVEVWGATADWKDYFHEKHTQIDLDTGEMVEISDSDEGSYMARLALFNRDFAQKK